MLKTLSSLLLSFTLFIHLQAQENHELFFLSDCQEPLRAEEIYLKPFRNKEARDTLFADIIRHKPSQLFLLGDLTSNGSSKRKWVPLDRFIQTLQKFQTRIFAIPGNHEYKFNPSRGIREYQKRFPGESVYGYCVRTDSLAIVMLNSNFPHLTIEKARLQHSWYQQVLDSLDHDKSILTIIVCAHHAPYSNSSVVGDSKMVEQSFVPAFEKSMKAKLFITGHSHNLEFFHPKPGKNFLVIGGGGGLTQPLLPEKQRIHKDLIVQDVKPLYFYLIIHRKGHHLILTARGIKKNFSRFSNLIVGQI